MRSLGLFLLYIGLSLAEYALLAVVARDMWGWFVVPIFSLPQIPFLYAYGMVVLVRFLRGYSESRKEEPSLSMLLVVDDFCFQATMAGYCWLVAYTVHSFT